MKVYIGDSVYCENKDGSVEFVLTVENGIDVKETIFLDFDLMAPLVDFVLARMGMRNKHFADLINQ